MYRFIRMTSDGNVVAECYRNFETAYRRCIPDVLAHYVLKMSHATLTELNDQNYEGAPVIVAWNQPEDAVMDNSYLYTACWIQKMDNIMLTAFPMLVMPQEI